MFATDQISLAEAISARIRRLARERGWSQERLRDEIFAATGVRLSVATVGRACRGDTMPESRTLAAIAATFGEDEISFVRAALNEYPLAATPGYANHRPLAAPPFPLAA